MKKFLSISCICLVIILSFGFAGCVAGNSNASLSYTLEYNINKLTNILNKTEEAKTSELIIPEIYSPNENITSGITPLKQGDLTTLPSIDKQIVSTEEIENEQSAIMPRTSLSSSKIGAYNPRRLTNVNYTNSGYNSYLGKVEDLYVMVNDAVYANESICNCKNNILAYCEFLAEVAKQLKDNKIEVSKEQTESCNNLLKELSKATNKLTDTRNEISSRCKGLSQKKSLSNGIDTINSKYVTLVNCLDNRLTNYQNILALLAQLQCVLNGNCQTDSTTSNDVLNNLKNLENLNDLLNGNKTNLNSNNSNEKCFTDESGRTYCLDNNGNLYTRDEKGNRIYLKNCPNGTCNGNSTVNNGNGTCNGNTVIDDGNVICPNANSTTNSTKTISSKNKVNPEKVADYNTNDEEKTEKTERKSNIDTFKDKTITPNVIKKENKKHDNTKQNTTENNTNLNNQNNQEIPIVPTPTQLPNNTNTYGYGNGVYGSPINGTYGGAYGNGFGGVYGGGYNGIYNYENGITNPYRNTDTYKFPPQSSTQIPSTYAPGTRLKTEALQGVLMEKPLPQEKRQDFKAFGVAEPNINLEKEDEIKTLEETNENELSSKEPTEQRGEKIFDRLV